MRAFFMAVEESALMNVWFLSNYKAAISERGKNASRVLIVEKLLHPILF